MLKNTHTQGKKASNRQDKKGEGEELEVIGQETEKKERENQIATNKPKVAAFTSPNKGSAGHFPQLGMT